MDGKIRRYLNNYKKNQNAKKNSFEVHTLHTRQSEKSQRLPWCGTTETLMYY